MKDRGLLPSRFAGTLLLLITVITPAQTHAASGLQKQELWALPAEERQLLASLVAIKWQGTDGQTASKRGGSWPSSTRRLGRPPVLLLLAGKSGGEIVGKALGKDGGLLCGGCGGGGGRCLFVLAL